MSLVEIISCPICTSRNFTHFLECKDYTTTGESFELKQCSICSFIFTSPRPDDNSIGSYYESASYISHTGKSSAFFDSVYLFVRSFTLRWKTSLVAAVHQPKYILDYGCGTGGFLNACANLGWKSFGVEPSAQAHEKASSNAALTITKTLSEINGQKFDAITLWHVLEHVSDLKEKLHELKSRLNENGTLFVAVPNHTSYDGNYYGSQWAGYDVPRHLWHFSTTTITLLAKETGLTIHQILPMKLDAYYVSLLSEKYKNGRHTISGVINAILTAIKSNRKAKPQNNYSSLIYILK